MSPAVQKGPLGDLHANGPSPREERVEAPRRLTQGATAGLGDLALLRSILLRMAKRVLARPVPPSARSRTPAEWSRQYVMLGLSI
jgi:hypothetical protein